MPKYIGGVHTVVSVITKCTSNPVEGFDMYYISFTNTLTSALGASQGHLNVADSRRHHNQQGINYSFSLTYT